LLALPPSMSSLLIGFVVAAYNPGRTLQHWRAPGFSTSDFSLALPARKDDARCPERAAGATLCLDIREIFYPVQRTRQGILQLWHGQPQAFFFIFVHLLEFLGSNFIFDLSLTLALLAAELKQVSRFFGES
jgi:hypothetical protein